MSGVTETLRWRLVFSSMRILVITPYLPWPLNSGGNAAQFSTLKSLAADHTFAVVCPLYDVEQTVHLQQLSAALPQVRFVGVPLWLERMGPPEANPLFRLARRMVQLIRNRRASNVTAPAALYYPFNPQPMSLLKAVTDELARGIDLCQVEFAEMMSLGCWLPGTLPKLFIHHQIHFVYAQRFMAAQGDPDEHARYLAAMMRCQELAYLKHYQTIVTFSREDGEAIQPWLPDANVVISPFPVPADVDDTGKIAAAFSGNFHFIASGAHNPNRDALEWLLKEIWPAIVRALPTAHLHIVGEWSPEDRAAFTHPGIVFRGFVKNLSPVLQGGILLVPLRIGSGLRVKILTALALGVPVVTTTIGAEGLLITNGKEMLVADAPDDFSRAAIKLAQEPALRLSLAHAGRAALKQNYAPASVRARRNEIYESLIPAKDFGAEVGKSGA
jgi:glycosyltransferase involved in cell wall biosynthesis